MSGENVNSKVARLIEEYGMDDLGAELEARWTRTEDRDGLRELATRFNVALVESTLKTADIDTLAREPESLYELLTDESVSSGVRTETRNTLASQGVDVEKLRGDFVSKQAIHTYLKKVREAEPPRDTSTAAEKRDQTDSTIQQVKQRLTAVTKRAVENLRNTGRLTIGDFNVTVTVRIQCLDCGSQFRAGELLEAGSCDCEQ